MYQMMGAQTAILPVLEAASLRIQSSIQSSFHAHDLAREKVEEASAMHPIAACTETNSTNYQSLTLVRKDIHVLQERQLQNLDENATTLKGILQTVTQLKVITLQRPTVLVSPPRIWDANTRTVVDSHNYNGVQGTKYRAISLPTGAERSGKWIV
jgi:hypothetical protein